MGVDYGLFFFGGGLWVVFGVVVMGCFFGVVVMGCFFLGGGYGLFFLGGEYGEGDGFDGLV